MDSRTIKNSRFLHLSFCLACKYFRIIFIKINGLKSLCTLAAAAAAADDAASLYVSRLFQFWALFQFFPGFPLAVETQVLGAKTHKTQQTTTPQKTNKQKQEINTNNKKNTFITLRINFVQIYHKLPHILLRIGGKWKNI